MPISDYSRHLGDSGVIGSGILQDFDLLFDLTDLRESGTKTVWFTRLSRTPKIDTNTGTLSSGIVGYETTNAVLKITAILETCAASQAGILPGTVITRINDTPIKAFTGEEISDLLFTSACPIRLTVLEDEIERTVLLTP